MEVLNMVSDDFVQLARLALSGKAQDVQLFVKRATRRYQESLPKLVEGLNLVLRESPTRSSPLRREAVSPVPVDLDSRLQLVRVEDSVDLPVKPILRPSIKDALEQFIEERKSGQKLSEVGLVPTKSLLFTGPPGVGKTLTARWISYELKLPLLVLDLAAVMSSFLGRTGNNLRYVLDYAKSTPCVLLLDEFDAVAKRRDDSGEVGELKRLVTVLLQEIDQWPASGILIAATNHAELLDPAVWRRFELKIEFPVPDREETKAAILTGLSELKEKDSLLETLTTVLEGSSFSEIERRVLLIRRSAAMKNLSIDNQVVSAVREAVQGLNKKQRSEVAHNLVKSGVSSQREAHELTGVSRDTIRKMAVKSNISND